MESRDIHKWLDRVAGAVVLAVSIIAIVAYSWTVDSGPLFSERVVTVVTSWTTTDRFPNEPLGSTVLWLCQVLLFGCLVVLLVVLQCYIRRMWKWWKSRTSPSSINRTVVVKLQVTNDSQDFKNTRQRIEFLGRKRGPLTIGFLTWLNNKPPREVSVLSINEVVEGYSSHG